MHSVEVGIETPARAPRSRQRAIVLLEAVSLVWLLLECGVALDAAAGARSPVLLAFGSDSFVELLSAAVVLLQFTPLVSLSEQRATRIAAVLLFVLAGVVGAVSIVSLALHAQPAASRGGIAITVGALLVMPVLGRLKRREARRSGNRALGADAVQSSACAFLAAIALSGLALNAAVHAPWLDSVAALACLPILIKEGRAVWRGEGCGCCGVHPAHG